jgi:cyanophycinase
MKILGHILLEGGAEFGGRMSEPDNRAITLAGGFDAPLSIIPTAAAPDHNDRSAGQNGVRWFRKLGVRKVESLPLIDRKSADTDEIAKNLLEARFIYLLGGFPGYLNQTLTGSQSWQSILQAYQKGAVVGGSSAGAMALCEHFYDPYTGSITQGLNLIPGVCVIPHHNTFGQGWVSRLSALLPDDVLVGIDEETGMLDDAPEGGWTVYGRGRVTLYRRGKVEVFQAAQSRIIPRLR